AGTRVTLMAKEGDWATLRMPSGEMRRVHIDCRATIGSIGNAEHANVQWGKAGRMRWRGIRPHNRGVSMNPVDHPTRGGERRHPRGTKTPDPYSPASTSGPSNSSSAAGRSRGTSMPRSVKKGPFVEHYIAKKMATAGKEANPSRRVITTYSRRSTVIPGMVGL